jgi:hypothetical protein
MTQFKLPITYLVDKRNLPQALITDLELVSDTNNSIYNKMLSPQSTLGERTINLWGKEFTWDKNYLKETQSLLKTELPTPITDCSDIILTFDEIKNSKTKNDNDIGFYAQYQYIEWDFLRPLNNNSQCLQWLSLYNMASPIIALIIPILFLILPFLLLRMKGVPITMDVYIKSLKVIFSKHQLGNIFNISSVTWDKRIYILISLIFYLVQIYQNFMTCRNFHRNMVTVHEHIFTVRKFITQSIDNMTQFENCTENLKKYTGFISDMKLHKDILIKINKDLDKITPNKLSVSKIFEIGQVMKCFYQLYTDLDYQNTLEYSLTFAGYIDNINGIKNNIHNKNLGKCKFTRKTKFNSAYYPITESEPIKNSYNLDNQMLITGPNAAGKTTMLKTTIFNIISSQQIGFGYYQSASIHLYQHLHCYINIPDTSGRDSLFQAEARRCKDILTNIEDFSKERHFCIFDELYSGTNPYEAIGSATSFLKYLNKNKNISFIITTHFLDLCKKLEKVDNINNMHMLIKEVNNDFNYTYKLVQGISNIKGGVKVLKELDYPEEIINGTTQIINNLNI